MNDDRLLFALKRLGDEELSAASDRKVRARLETAWTVRALTTARRTFSARRLVPLLAALVLMAGSTGTVLGATADSPLWGTRVAVESALAQLRGNAPKIETTPVVTSPSPSAIASASPSPVPSASPTSSATPTHTVAPTPVRTATPTTAPTPVRTEPPVTATPTPTVAPTKQPVTITGTVHDASGANVMNVCISTSPTPPTSSTACTIRTTTNGTYTIAASVTSGTSYTITLYAYFTDPASGALSGGSATATMTAPTTLMPLITLTPRR